MFNFWKQQHRKPKFWLSWDKSFAVYSSTFVAFRFNRSDFVLSMKLLDVNKVKQLVQEIQKQNIWSKTKSLQFNGVWNVLLNKMTMFDWRNLTDWLWVTYIHSFATHSQNVIAHFFVVVAGWTHKQTYDCVRILWLRRFRVDLIIQYCVYTYRYRYFFNSLNEREPILQR